MPPWGGNKNWAEVTWIQAEQGAGGRENMLVIPSYQTGDLGREMEAGNSLETL